MVMVAADQDDGNVGSAALLKEGVERAFCLWRRHVGVERVTADQYRVDSLAFRDAEDFNERSFVFFGPAPLAQQLAKVPIARVKKPHDTSPRKGSPAADAASRARVAQAGNGNCTSSGTGISGWWTMRVPGF